MTELVVILLLCHQWLSLMISKKLISNRLKRETHILITVILRMTMKMKIVYHHHHHQFQLTIPNINLDSKEILVLYLWELLEQEGQRAKHQFIQKLEELQVVLLQNHLQKMVKKFTFIHHWPQNH